MTSAPDWLFTHATVRQKVRLLLERKAIKKQLNAQERSIFARIKPSQDARTARLNVQASPALLGGFAELYQRNDPYHHGAIAFAYRSLLREMINPLPTLQDATPKPRRIDFAALPLAARPYLLGPYLTIEQNQRFAEVDLARSRPTQGLIVMVQTGGPVDIEQWRSQIPALNAWLTDGSSSATWVIRDHTATTVTLVLQGKLPATIAFSRTYLAVGALFVGIDTITQRALHIPFADLTAGTYIPGASGSGKTNALHILLRSIFANLSLFSAVYLVDGKDGVGLSRYARLHPKIRVLYDEPDVWKLAEHLNAEMRHRNALQRAQGVEKTTRNFIALVVDELPTFIAKPPKAQKAEHEAFIDNLQRIAMRGRSAGIRMFLISQSPVSDQVPVTLRTNCSTVISFRLPENAHATAVFGELDASKDPRKLPTGQAIVLQADAGRHTTVQFPLAPPYRQGPHR